MKLYNHGEGPYYPTKCEALVVAFNQEKALVGAFSVIVKTGCGTDGALYSTSRDRDHPTPRHLNYVRDQCGGS